MSSFVSAFVDELAYTRRRGKKETEGIFQGKLSSRSAYLEVMSVVTPVGCDLEKRVHQKIHQ